LQDASDCGGNDAGWRLGVEGHLVTAYLGRSGDGDLPSLAVGTRAPEREPTEVEATVLRVDVYVRAVVHDDVEVVGGELIHHERGLTRPEQPLTQPQSLDGGGESGTRGSRYHRHSPL